MRTTTPRPRCAARTSSARRSEVVEKILFQQEIFRHDRFLVQFTIGGIPHEGILRSIELLGREVAPAVREKLGES